MRLARIIAASIAFGFIAAAFAQEWPPPPLTLQGDADRGAQLAEQVCSSCHLANGNSTVPTFPRLSGQDQQWLQAFHGSLGGAPGISTASSRLSPRYRISMPHFPTRCIS